MPEVELGFVANGLDRDFFLYGLLGFSFKAQHLGSSWFKVEGLSFTGLLLGNLS